jgi:triosephosphate isomerase
MVGAATSSGKLALVLSAIAFITETNAFTSPMVTPMRPASRLPEGVSAASRSGAKATLGLRMAERTPFMAGNWKMNPTNVDEAMDLAKAIAAGKGSSKAEVAIFIPHPFIAACKPHLDSAGIAVGGQNCISAQKGAFTGATSTSMIKSLGCPHMLVGHSERRTLFRMDDESVNENVLKILSDGLKPILCVGETQEEYNLKLNTQICAIQLSKGLKSVTKEQMKSVTIAYEPVWAIGTGLVCDKETAQSVHAFIRGWLAKMYDQETADAVRIQYGGSVTPESVDELMAMPDIDGCLVGGASLDPAKFARIMNFQ